MISTTSGSQFRFIVSIAKLLSFCHYMVFPVSVFSAFVMVVAPGSIKQSGCGIQQQEGHAEFLKAIHAMFMQSCSRRMEILLPLRLMIKQFGCGIQQQEGHAEFLKAIQIGSVQSCSRRMEILLPLRLGIKQSGCGIQQQEGHAEFLKAIQLGLLQSCSRRMESFLPVTMSHTDPSPWSYRLNGQNPLSIIMLSC